MLRQILLAKLHRATVTECDLNYNGSIKIDEELLEKSGMREFEQVDVFDITNGNRFSTYINHKPCIILLNDNNKIESIL